MYRHIGLILGLHLVIAAPPLKISIDCGSHETDNTRSFHGSRSNHPTSSIDVDSICSIIHNALPKSVNDGKFILIGEPADQSRASNNFAPITVKPPRGFPRPRIRVPKLKVPSLKPKPARTLYAPRVGRPMYFPPRRKIVREEDSSAERMEKFKKGIQKMLHVVKTLGQIDQYISERTRSVVNVFSKIFSEPDDR